jgi:hypothetical protein
MRAQGRQEVERGEDAGQRTLRIAAEAASPAAVDDLAAFGAIAQARKYSTILNTTHRNSALDRRRK